MSETSSTTAPAGPKAAWGTAKAAWRQFLAQQDGSQDPPDVRIGLAASFTANTLSQFVGAHLVSEGFKPKVAIGPYNQLFQVCLDPKSHFGNNCDAIAILWRIEDLMGDECDAFLNHDGAALTRGCDKLATLTGAITSLRSEFSGMIIISVPAIPTGLSVGLSALDHATGLGHFHRVLTSRFIDIANKIENIRLVELRRRAARRWLRRFIRPTPMVSLSATLQRRLPPSSWDQDRAYHLRRTPQCEEMHCARLR